MNDPRPTGCPQDRPKGCVCDGDKWDHEHWGPVCKRYRRNRLFGWLEECSDCCHGPDCHEEADDE